MRMFSENGIEVIDDIRGKKKRRNKKRSQKRHPGQDAKELARFTIYDLHHIKSVIAG